MIRHLQPCSNFDPHNNFLSMEIVFGFFPLFLLFSYRHRGVKISCSSCRVQSIIPKQFLRSLPRFLTEKNFDPTSNFKKLLFSFFILYIRNVNKPSSRPTAERARSEPLTYSANWIRFGALNSLNHATLSTPSGRVKNNPDLSEDWDPSRCLRHLFTTAVVGQQCHFRGPSQFHPDLEAGPQIFAKSLLGGAPYQKEKKNKAQSNQSLKVKYLEIHPIFYN